jgi:hypothetical protein
VLSPRELSAREGMPAWPKRFPRARVKEYEYELGQYAFAGQCQQSPIPRKGGIFKREYWQPYIVPSAGKEKGKWPDFDFVLVSVDSAFTEKEENDPTGCIVSSILVIASRLFSPRPRPRPRGRRRPTSLPRARSASL